MMKRFVATALVTAGLLAAASPAMAACTDQQVEAKVIELSNLMGPLATRNPTEAQKITEELTPLMVATASDETCAAYDRLIARAKR